MNKNKLIELACYLMGPIFMILGVTILSYALPGYVRADVIRACAEACKDHGGIKTVNSEICECKD